MIENTERTLRKYVVPDIGNIRLIHNPKCELNGPYYSRIEKYGMAARNSQTEEEARIRTGVRVQTLLESKQSELKRQLAPINDSIEKMSVISPKLNLLNSFQTNHE